MTEQALKLAAQTYQKIASLREELTRSQEKLNLVNQHVKAAQSWEFDLCLKRGDNYTRSITLWVKLPVEVIQQQAVNEVCRLRREIILLGGTP